VPPLQFGGATQSGPKSAYWNPYQVGLWKAWITGSLIFTEVSNFSSEAAAAASIRPLQALGVDAEEVPHGTQVALLGRLMDVLASGHEPNPWKLLEGARLVNRDTQIATPSRTGKPEIKKSS